MVSILEIVNNKIKTVRKLKGLSQEQLALKSGLHRAYIGQIERGEKKIGIENLHKIAVALEVNIKDFFDK